MKRVAQYLITSTIDCVSGVRVGGGDDILQIGGVDLTCIKHPVTLQPYLPGSSIKGKMRSELEKEEGRFSGRDGNEPCNCGKRDCLVCRVFGSHKNPRYEFGPTRIIVRDALALGDVPIETKTENVIDRKLGTALHPRKVERAASGARFSLEIGMNVWDIDEHCAYAGKAGSHALIAFIMHGLTLVQRSGIGSGGSKGYGQVRFPDAKVVRLGDAPIPYTEESE